jgi:spore coat polysaccharide biosynthesis protein SpsF
MKAVAIIQARMSSTRLPGKVLLPLAQRPVIWHIWKRAKRCKSVQNVVVATSTDETDDQLVSFCKSEGIDYVRGSLNNVLDRFFTVLEEYPADYVVRITGDCPLIHPPFIDAQLKALEYFKGDLAWCKDPGCAFEGQSVHSVRSLRLVVEMSTDPDDREHVGSTFFVLHPDLFRVVEVCPPQSLSARGFRLTIDEPADYEMFTMLFESLGTREAPYVALRDALSWLKKHPDVARINAQVHHKQLNLTLNKIRSELKPSLVGKWPLSTKR